MPCAISGRRMRPVAAAELSTVRPARALMGIERHVLETHVLRHVDVVETGDTGRSVLIGCAGARGGSHSCVAAHHASQTKRRDRSLAPMALGRSAGDESRARPFSVASRAITSAGRPVSANLARLLPWRRTRARGKGFGNFDCRSPNPLMSGLMASARPRGAGDVVAMAHHQPRFPAAERLDAAQRQPSSPPRS
jgi:hypothetical protein